MYNKHTSTRLMWYRPLFIDETIDEKTIQNNIVEADGDTNVNLHHDNVDNNTNSSTTVSCSLYVTIINIYSDYTCNIPMGRCQGNITLLE